MIGREREQIVGKACCGLRRRGYKLRVGAYGPEIDPASHQQIVGKVDALIGLLGGIEVVEQLFRILHDSNMYHDGMWLFGETGLTFYGAKQPALPVGWILSLATRNLSRRSIARKPEVAWKTLVELAADYAAAHDCQRYNPYDGMFLHPAQLHRTLANSTLRRELFSLPQMPVIALRSILESLERVVTPEDNAILGFSSKLLVKEINSLMDFSTDTRLTIFTDAERRSPLITTICRKPSKQIKTDPATNRVGSERTQDNTPLLECGPGQFAALPKAILAASACHFLFELIWSRLGKRAADIVSKTMERAIADCCEGKATSVYSGLEYWVGKKRYELDVATRDDDRIVLIETKARTLTRQARSGDMFKFFEDYSESFLRLLNQLSEREDHLRNGFVPLTSDVKQIADLRPIKIAVSPTSFGPVSDKLLCNNILRSLDNVRLRLINHNDDHDRILKSFNKRTSEIIERIRRLAPRKGDSPDLFRYLIDVFWLDIGQIIYVLDRANTTWDAFSPLKLMTFNSRDFWTELAQADRAGITRGKWRQVHFEYVETQQSLSGLGTSHGGSSPKHSTR